MPNPYLDLIALVERLHRQFLEVVKLELDTHGVHDINNVQAMILYNIGDLEMTVGELTLRGCYLGSNVSYNVKKMLENEYIVQERSPHDRRSVRVRLSDKGLALHAKISKMHERHVGALLQHQLHPRAHETHRGHVANRLCGQRVLAVPFEADEVAGTAEFHDLAPSILGDPRQPHGAAHDLVSASEFIAFGENHFVAREAANRTEAIQRCKRIAAARRRPPRNARVIFVGHRLTGK